MFGGGVSLTPVIIGIAIITASISLGSLTRSLKKAGAADIEATYLARALKDEQMEKAQYIRRADNLSNRESNANEIIAQLRKELAEAQLPEPTGLLCKPGCILQ